MPTFSILASSVIKYLLSVNRVFYSGEEYSKSNLICCFAGTISSPQCGTQCANFTKILIITIVNEGGTLNGETSVNTPLSLCTK